MLVSANERRTKDSVMDSGINPPPQGAVMGEGLSVQPTQLSKTIAIDAALQRRAERTVVKVEEVLNGFAERDGILNSGFASASPETRNEVLTAVRRFPARAAEFAEWPEWVEERLRD